MGKKKIRQDFLKEGIDEILDIGANLKAIEPPELNLPARVVGSMEGWWLAVRSSAIARCIVPYLIIMRKQAGITLDFMDLQAGPGTISVVKDKGDVRYTFPGPALLAAWQGSFGTDFRFDNVFVSDKEPSFRTALKQRLDLLAVQLSKNAIKGTSHHVPSIAVGHDEELDADAAADQVIQAVTEKHGKFYHYLWFVDLSGLDIKYSTIKKLHDKLPYGDIIIDYNAVAIESAFTMPRGYKVLDELFGTLVPRGDVSLGLKELYMHQLKAAGFRSVESITAAPADAPFKHELFFCSRAEKPSWTGTIAGYNARLASASTASVATFWDTIGRKSPTLLDMLENVKNTATAIMPASKEFKGEFEILIEQKDGGFAPPLLAGTDDFIWKDILSKNAFDALKINGDTVIFKKRISITDLAMKSACIQGKIREKLGISALETRDIYLLDRRSREFGKASFPADGRLDGTGFWLQLYKNTVQDGNFVFLAKVADAKKIVIIIDYYQQLYPIISFLKDYYQFCKDVKESNVALTLPEDA
nr:hypothetical protein [Candidatus Sigynarchaeota archaeon]